MSKAECLIETRDVTLVEAVNMALHRAMADDDNVVVLGELKSSGKGDGNGAQQDQFIVGAAPSSKRARANRDKVVPHNGTATIRRTLPLSLTFDHRAATGGEAARFLGAMMMAMHNEG